jgi:hypothetical protein
MPTYEVQISPAPPGELRALGAGGSDRYISKNQPLKLIILDLWNTTLARVAFPEKLDQRNYDVNCRSTASRVSCCSTSRSRLGMWAVKVARRETRADGESIRSHGPAESFPATAASRKRREMDGRRRARIDYWYSTRDARYCSYL